MSEPVYINLGRVTATPPNWDINDPTKPGYIQNRPFYSDGVERANYLAPTYLSHLETSNGLSILEFPVTDLLEVTAMYTITINGVSLELQVVEEVIDGVAIQRFGDNYASIIDGNDLVYGFAVATSSMFSGYGMLVVADIAMFKNLFKITTDEEYTGATVQITYIKEIVHKIPQKYLPFKTILVNQATDMLTIDFSQYHPGDIILVVREVNPMSLVGGLPIGGT